MRRGGGFIGSVAAVLSVVVFGSLGAAGDVDDDVAVGKALFRRLWVPAPTRTDAADGLGPLFNARSCAACHADGGPALVKKDVDGARVIAGAVFRVSDVDGQTHPWYGRQLQTGAVPGLQPEAVARLVVTGAGSSGVRPDVRLLGPRLGPHFRLGPRVAPSLEASAMIGRVAEAALRERASAATQQALGLNGRPRILADARSGGAIGRFGWKASQADLVNQIADAFAYDLGLSSPLRPRPYGDCTPAQTACLAMPNGESPAFDGREISTAIVGKVAAYVRSLGASPAAASPDAEKLLAATGCSGCHAPHMPADDGTPIALYSDLLLHDMGAGLDDGVAEPGVRSSEWRTAPLVDLAPRAGQRRYLHDGRGATIAAAISWHDGEARSSRLAFEALSAAERSRLIRYLQSR